MLQNQTSKAMKAMKVIACLTLSAMYGCVSMSHNNHHNFIKASAEDEKISIAIDQKTLTTDQLRDCDYTVPVFVRMDQSASINTAEMMIRVDSRCDFEAVTDPMLSYEKTEDFLIMEMISSSKFEDNAMRFLWASGNNVDCAGSLVLLLVHVPENVQGGERFEISYLPEATYGKHKFEHIWGRIGLDSVDYAQLGQVEWSDGWIEIVSDDPAETVTLPGDVNLDGVVDIADVVMMNRVYVGVESINAQGTANGDTDNDGKITLTDSMNVLRYLVHLIDDLENI